MSQVRSTSLDASSLVAILVRRCRVMLSPCHFHFPSAQSQLLSDVGAIVSVVLAFWVILISQTCNLVGDILCRLVAFDRGWCHISFRLL
eukprot:5782887-Amphidinium_carterae.2